jgi:hypothetical protein
VSDVANRQSRNSRWTREPVSVGGRSAVAYPTDRDIEIFRLLARYRYLPSDYIHAFVGGSFEALSRRLNLLSRKPNLYLARPHQQRESADANCRRLVYELDKRGSTVLQERGLSFLPKSYHRNFAHELMVAQIMASIELGTTEVRSVRMISWSEILASDNTPKATRESSTPATIPVSLAANGQSQSISVTADAQPFGLERLTEGKRSYLFFPGIEADCGTEPIETSNFDRSSLFKKFLAYLAIAEQGIYRSHFGFPNFFVPFITTTQARSESMQRMVAKLTHGRGSKMFLFKVLQTVDSAERRPNGHMLTEPWVRVGHPPLSLIA